MQKQTTKVSHRPVIVKIAGECAWYVLSDSNPDKMYRVTLHSCECKAFEFRGGICKHMDKVMAYLLEQIEGLPKDDLVELLEKSIELIQRRKLKPEEEFDP
jgi:SWIM zinc finger